MHAQGVILATATGRQCLLSGLRERPPRRQRRSRRAAAAPTAGFFDDIFNFESWAPKSSQAWRLGKDINSKGEGTSSIDEAAVETLNQRLAAVRAGQGASSSAAAATAEAASPQQQQQQQPLDDSPGASFLHSTDEEFASALSDRLAEVASATMAPVGPSGGGGGGGAAAAAAEEVLSGPLLRDLIFEKWGKSYDVSFVRRDLPLGKTLICLNVMWTHLEQRSFPMSSEEYDEKLDMVALYLSSWGQSERVAAFLRLPARPRKGMPSKPIMGTAISIQLDLEDAVIDEFFAQGGV